MADPKLHPQTFARRHPKAQNRRVRVRRPLSSRRPAVPRILVATDRSPSADRAVEWAAEMAERYDAEDLRTRVHSAMICLPPRQREVLERYYGESLTLREAGLRMGISEARAWQLHGRAIQNLRRQLSVFVPPHVAAPRVAVAA